MEIKLVISYPDGKTEQKELKGEEAERFIGYKIGDSFDGKSVGLSDSLKITGGSDKDGFPMKKGVYGVRREKLLLAGGIGYNPKDEGIRRKKRVRGDTITEEIVQINTKIEAKPAKKAAAKKPKAEPVEEPAPEAVEEKPAKKKAVKKPKAEPVEGAEEAKPAKKKVTKKPKAEPVEEEKPSMDEEESS